MDYALKVFKKLQNIINGIIGLVLIGIMCIVLVQTFTRYVIFYSLPWSEELSRYLFVIMIMFGINIGISKNMMVRIDLIDNFLSVKVKKIFEIGREIIALITITVFFYSSIGMVKLGSFQKSPAMQIPMSVIYSFLFVGFLFAVLSVIVRIIEMIRNGRRSG